MYCKTIFFFSVYATFASDNPSHFRKKFLERISKLTMTIDDKFRDEKLQYDINREAVKISALSAGKMDKYNYLTSEETLPTVQRRVTDQALQIFH